MMGIFWGHILHTGNTDKNKEEGKRKESQRKYACAHTDIIYTSRHTPFPNYCVHMLIWEISPNCEHGLKIVKSLLDNMGWLSGSIMLSVF